jgi:hypothetical protein
MASCGASHYSSGVAGGPEVAPQQMDEVFLLLFLQKKKALLALSGRSEGSVGPSLRSG